MANLRRRAPRFVKSLFVGKWALHLKSFGLSCILVISIVIPTQAFIPALTISPLPQSLYTGQYLTIRGTLTSACKQQRVTVSRKVLTRWIKLGNANVTDGKRWSFTTRVPSSTTSIIYRADCQSTFLASIMRPVSQTAPITYAGPGRRIWGADISRWQHIDGYSIDFEKMADANLAFVIVKASDGRFEEDARTSAYARKDVPAAKKAGLIVGYYHMVLVPTGNQTTVLVASAKRQAQLIANRLEELGGYDNRTLPYTIDMEAVPSSVSQTALSVWTRTLVSEVKRLTGRTPMLYSYRVFLASRYPKTQSAIQFLRTMHLWLAQPGNPADPKVRVGQKVDNATSCYQTAWATTSCKTVWTMWQYTSRGNRETFGIPWSPLPGSSCPSHAKLCVPGRGTGPLHLDLNVFNGKIIDMQRLAAGTWQREPDDYIEPTPTPSPSVTQTP